eukprot:XP_001704271.1 Hypothetical protein GL50803_24477 [Giardia lamblia ATCC 50803]
MYLERPQRVEKSTNPETPHLCTTVTPYLSPIFEAGMANDANATEYMSLIH